MSISKSRAETHDMRSTSAAHRIDLLKLAEAGTALTGTLDFVECERLADRLAAPQNPAHSAIEYRIIGGHDAPGRPTVTIALEGDVPLICQRCLQPFAFPLASESTMCLAATERQLADWDNDAAEALLAAAPVDCRELIEDELLLCLPYAPRHAEDECAGNEVRPALQVEAERPLQGLAQLKRR